MGSGSRCAWPGRQRWQDRHPRDAAPQALALEPASLLGDSAHLRCAAPFRGLGNNMNFSKITRRAVQAMAIVLALAIPTLSAITPADARIGGGFSSGSRGSRSFSTPPSTSTAPGTTQPFNRSTTQPYNSGINSPVGGGFFNRPGGGLLRG